MLIGSHAAAPEAIRQPLEDHLVTISRATGTLTFPANFQLIAAMNPCPCGYWGDPTHRCTCSPAMVTRYQKRISGPLLDRFDTRSAMNQCYDSASLPTT